jgi:hypothetical protein
MPGSVKSNALRGMVESEVEESGKPESEDGAYLPEFREVRPRGGYWGL